MNTTVFIYALKRPLTGGVRYVGKAVHPKSRFARHLREIYREDTHKSRWISGLINDGNRPVLEILEHTNSHECDALEAAYIQFFRECGEPLTNTTDGGDGWSIGMRHKENTKKKQSLAQLGIPKSSAHRAALSAWQIGRVLPEATRQKLSVAGRGRKHTPEELEKMRAAHLGNKNPMFGKTRPPEVRAKVSASLRKTWEKRTLK